MRIQRSVAAAFNGLVAWLLLLSCCEWQSLSRPLWVEFDHHLYGGEFTLKKVLLTNEVCPPEYQRVIDSESLERMRSVAYRFEVDDDSLAVGGVATCLDSNGAFVRVRFRVVPNRQVFESFVASQLAKRGDTASVVWNGGAATISKPPVSLAPGHTRRFGDLHISFDSGVVVWGAPRLDQVVGAPFGAIAEIAKKAGNHDWAFYASPSAVPDRYRNVALAVIDQLSAVDVQQRDEESDESYRSRRAIADFRGKMIHQVVDEVDEVFAFVDEPTESTDFRAGFTISVAKNSLLADLVSQLTATDSVATGAELGDVVDGAIQFRLPAEIKLLLSEVVANSQLLSSASLISTIENALPKLRLLVSSKDSHAPLAMLSCGLDETVFTEWMQMLDLPVGSLREGRLPISSLLGESQFSSWTLHWRRSSQGILFSLAEIPSAVVSHQESPELPTAVRKPLIKLSLDLSGFSQLPENSDLKSHFELAERIYELLTRRKHKAVLEHHSANNSDRFVSLIHALPTAQPLHLSVSLNCSADGTDLSADCRVSRGLYAWFLARQRVTAVTLFKGIGVGARSLD